jgi:hypothetical protein
VLDFGDFLIFLVHRPHTPRMTTDLQSYRVQKETRRRQERREGGKGGPEIAVPQFNSFILICNREINLISIF